MTTQAQDQMQQLIEDLQFPYDRGSDPVLLRHRAATALTRLLDEQARQWQPIETAAPVRPDCACQWEGSRQTHECFYHKGERLALERRVRDLEAAQTPVGPPPPPEAPWHRWKTQRQGGDPSSVESYECVTTCEACGVEMTDENREAPCE